ncbi:MAG: helix-turn-helix transcriptional regulator, partial [Ruminococcaceae bacterium]|nr:helix-turn-helix transcriptional regulator [Oscillospiraceae bacterium]
QAIYKWQRGDAMPTLDNIVALAAIFGVTVDEILVYRERLQLLISA